MIGISLLTIAIHRAAIALAAIAWLHGVVGLELSVITAMNDSCHVGHAGITDLQRIHSY